MNNKKYAQEKLEELNQLTGFDFELRGNGIKDWSSTMFTHLRSKNMDDLGDNIESAIMLIKAALNKKGIDA